MDVKQHRRYNGPLRNASGAAFDRGLSSQKVDLLSSILQKAARPEPEAFVYFQISQLAGVDDIGFSMDIDSFLLMNGIAEVEIPCLRFPVTVAPYGPVLA